MASDSDDDFQDLPPRIPRKPAKVRQSIKNNSRSHLKHNASSSKLLKDHSAENKQQKCAKICPKPVEPVKDDKECTKPQTGTVDDEWTIKPAE